MEQRPKKNIKRIFSIRWKIGIAVGLVVIVISAISFLLAMFLHVSMTMTSVIDMDFYSVGMIKTKLDHNMVADIFKSGRDIYYSIPEEIRSDNMSEEYRAYFESMKTDEYQAVKEQLIELAEFEDLKWLDLRLYDRENYRWVYLMDTDSDNDGRYDTGYWEYDSEGLSTFMGLTEEEEGLELGTASPLDVLLALRYYDNLRNLERFSVMDYFFDPVTGEFLGYIGAGEQYSDYLEEVSMFQTLYLMVIAIILIPIFLISDFIISRRMVKPLLNLADAASNYVDEEDKTRNQGYFERVKITTKDELLLLKNSMVEMESDLTRYVNDISRMTADRERVAVEMEMSSRIQTSLLPQKLENYAGEHSFDIFALIDSAKDVGGDFYDYYAIDDDHIAVTIADVSGKGVPAALFMVVTKTLLQMSGTMHESPEEILRTVNRQLYEQNKETMFVTVFFGIYTVSEKKLVYVNAGHEDLAVYKKSEGRFVMNREEHDLVVAIMPNAEFTERTLLLEPGDRIFMYTDGVTEARNPQEEMFGEQRMTDALDTLKDLPGDELLVKMRECISSFAGGAQQFDDVTMLLLDVL